ncbi:hypothetical protein CARUB_v10007897mg, partial [Capsella rubella]
MENAEEGLDEIEAQRQRAGDNLQARGDNNEMEPPEFLQNLILENIFVLPEEYEPMNPEIFCAFSAGNEVSFDRMREHNVIMACFKSDQGDSVLHLAAASGRLALVKCIVSECPSLLLVSNIKLELPLHVAARAGHLAVVEALVQAVGFVSARLQDEDNERLNVYVMRDINGDTPLHLAMMKGRRHMRIVDCLLTANNTASLLANNDRISPLYMAIEAADRRHVQAILRTVPRGGDDRRTLNDLLHGRKDLVHAALKSKSTDILDDLLDKDASFLDERDEEGMTALSFGALIGFYKGVCKLLDRSIEHVFVCNDDGSFPTHVAVEKGHKRVTKEILRRCPDSIYLLNKQGQTILHTASKRGKDAFFVFRYTRKTGNGLLMGKQDVDGNTLLHLATLNWRPRTLYELLHLDYATSIIGTLNNKGLTAVKLAETNMQTNYIYMERVTLMVLLYYYACSRGVSQMFKQKITKRSGPPIDGNYKDYVNSLLVVAALIATMTFAAGFTLPGGFSTSPDSMGMAILGNKSELLYFLGFDVLAMQCSIVTIITLLWAQLGDPYLMHKSLNVALPTLSLAILCTTIAFSIGVFIAIPHGNIFLFIVHSSFALLFYVILYIAGPHVLLQAPNIPAIFGTVIIPFFMFLNEDCEDSLSKIKSQDSVQDQGPVQDQNQNPVQNQDQVPIQDQ